MITIEQMRRAAERCIAEPRCADDVVTARSLLECIDRGDTAENLEAADWWFNKPNPRLPELMQRYGE